MNHLEACGYCPHYEHGDGTAKTHTGCRLYADITWVNRIGGCGSFPFRELPPGYVYDHKGNVIPPGTKRAGQQKQMKEAKYSVKKGRKSRRAGLG